MDEMSEPTLLEAIYNTVRRMETEQIAQGKEQVRQRADIEALKLKGENREKRLAVKVGAVASIVTGVITGVVLLIIKKITG